MANEEIWEWAWLVVLYVLPFLSFALALCLPRACFREVPYRFLLAIAFLSLLPNLGVAVLLAVDGHPEWIKFFVPYGALAVGSVYGLVNPISWLRLLVAFIEICKTCGKKILIASQFLRKRFRPIPGGVSMFLVILAFCWLVPLRAPSQCGEMGLIRFRFQVTTYDSTYRSRTSFEEFLQLMTSYDVTQMPKYGTLKFFQRVGGLPEYLGVRDILCPGGSLSREPLKR